MLEDLDRHQEAANAVLEAVAQRIKSGQPLEESLIAASGVVHHPDWFRRRFVDEGAAWEEALPVRAVGGCSGAW